MDGHEIECVSNSDFWSFSVLTGGPFPIGVTQLDSSVPYYCSEPSEELC